MGTKYVACVDKLCNAVRGMRKTEIQADHLALRLVPIAIVVKCQNLNS